MSKSFINRSRNQNTSSNHSNELQKKIDPQAQLDWINNQKVDQGFGVFNNSSTGNETAQMFAKEEKRNEDGKDAGIQMKKDNVVWPAERDMTEQVAQAKDNGGGGYDNFQGDIGGGGGIKLTYSLSGGFSISLYGGLSKKLSEFGMIGANATLTFIRGGAGTSKSSPNLLEFALSPSLTLGYKDAPEIPLNLYIDQAGTGVQNPFKNSITMGGTFILSSGINSDGSRRHQRISGVGVRIGGAFALNSYNDTKKFPFFGPGSDQFRSAGINGSLQIGDNKLDWANDMYYGKSNEKATFHDDLLIGDHHYDNQNIYDLLLNNGRERLSFTNDKLGINETMIRSGAETFWPSNKMHDSMEVEDKYDKNIYPFHRLFVPYPNTQEQLMKYLEYKMKKKKVSEDDFLRKKENPKKQQ